MATINQNKMEESEEVCDVCGCVGYHNTLCPNNFINSDIYTYQSEQTE